MNDENKTRRRSKIYSNSDEQKKVSKPFKSGLGMKITIHRGTNQIGGCVTEYEHNGWRLFVDYGEELPGGPKTSELQVEGLTHGDLSKSALLITHYHGDHIGNVTKLPEVLPIYMGEVAREAGQNFTFGPFKIRPVTVNHSAFDAYAFRIEADGVSAYHTGDFRLYSYRSGKFFKMLEQYVGKVDYVVYHTNGHIEMNDVREFFRQLQSPSIRIALMSLQNCSAMNGPLSPSMMDNLFRQYLHQRQMPVVQEYSVLRNLKMEWSMKTEKNGKKLMVSMKSLSVFSRPSRIRSLLWTILYTDLLLLWAT